MGAKYLCVHLSGFLLLIEEVFEDIITKIWKFVTAKKSKEISEA